MARTSREVTNQVRRNILRYFGRKMVETARGARVSYREIEEALGYSQGRVRHACRQLVAEGCVRCLSCYAQDGGQRANVYLVTPKGWQFMELECELKQSVSMSEEESVA